MSRATPPRRDPRSTNAFPAAPLALLAVLTAVTAACFAAAGQRARGNAGPAAGPPSAPASTVVERAAPASPALPAADAPRGVASGPDPAGVDVSVESFISDLDQVTDMAVAGDGSDRFFFVEKKGDIRIWNDGAWLDKPFLDIQDRVESSTGNSGEKGLLGLAFAPDYAESGLFYVNYTSGAPRLHSVIARFHVTSDPNVADPSSEEQLLTYNQPFENHNGGDLNFGPDGYLYIGIGDGGSSDDPQHNGQNTSTILGSLARIDVTPGAASIIPPDNPFAGQAGKAQEIWSYGLRNPWRFTFDAVTGDLYIADVGQNAWEEVDVAQGEAPGKGVNYGWSDMEGNHCYLKTPCNPADYTLPVVEYGHGPACSITGGYVYRGAKYPGAEGLYLYSDWCSSQIWGLSQAADGTWRSAEVGEAPFRVTSFGVDEAGEILIMGLSTAGRILFTKVPPTPTPGGVTSTPSPTAAATTTPRITPETPTPTQESTAIPEWHRFFPAALADADA